LFGNAEQDVYFCTVSITPLPRGHIGERTTQSITDYTRDAYRAINRDLRNGIVTDQAAELIEAVSSLPAISGTTYRSFTIDDLSSYETLLKAKKNDGQPITFDAFSSTSRSQSIANRFNGNVRLVIEGKTGRDIAPMSDAPQEQETLYLPALTCLIRSVTTAKVGGKLWSITVVLTEI
jgi:hypothetical protein